jgi:hypothetical protein
MFYTTRQRTFDYIQLRWLEKTSGRPAHEWDLYIIKELLDNALDGDERWTRDQGGAIELSIDLHYRHVPVLDIRSLDIAITNRAPFPVAQLPAIFDLTAYTSNKSHYNQPTRGHQGNALKTILGIPYALRREFYGDYANIRKPLVIETADSSYLISFDIDERRQQVQLAELQPLPLKQSYNGTCIRVGIDRFIQEQPRTLDEVRAWAQRFALLNPHATFHWQVRIDNQQVQWRFPADPDWHGLFTDTAPIHWYEYTQVRDLLLVLERDYGAEMPLAQALSVFAGFTPADDPDGTRARTLCERVGFQTVGDLALTRDHAHTLRNRLLPALRAGGRVVPADALGGLGEAYMMATLTRLFDLPEPPLYRRVVQDDPPDPAHPFVLELALARLPAGNRRLIWTSLNHTPTYADPFYTRQLQPPILKDAWVYGLDGFLDAYRQTAEQPLLLLLHLVCPNLGFQDFSKTVIETRPFHAPLTATLHELLTELTATAQIDDLQPLVHLLLPQAIADLTLDGRQRFALPQLMGVVRRLLARQLQAEGRGELATTWFSDPGAEGRLRGYVEAFARTHAGVLANLIQPQRGRVTLPVHPEGHTTLALHDLNQQMLATACVNKLLLVTDPDIAAVIIANGLLARFDLALLHHEGSFDATVEALLPHLDRLKLPLLLLHHATPTECLLATRLRTRLAEAGLAQVLVHDLGLTPAHGQAFGLPVESGAGGGDRTALAQVLDAAGVTFLVDQQQQFSLFSLTVNELRTWLEQQFAAIGLPAKYVPDTAALHSAAFGCIRHTLTHRVVERLNAAYLADQVLHLVANDLDMNALEDQLHAALADHPDHAWRTCWNELTQTRCDELLTGYHQQITQLVRAHMQHLAENRTIDGHAQNTSLL